MTHDEHHTIGSGGGKASEDPAQLDRSFVWDREAGKLVPIRGQSWAVLIEWRGVVE